MRIDWEFVFSLAHTLSTVASIGLSVYGGVNAGVEINENPKISREEKIQIVLRHEIPAIVCLAGSMGYSAMARRIRKIELLKAVSLMGLSASQLKDYREEVAKEYGIDEEEKIRKRVNAKRYSEGVDEDGMLEELEHTFYEPVTQTYFSAPTSVVMMAINHCNTWIFEERTSGGLATISDFLINMNLTRLTNKRTDRAGWRSDLINPTMGLPLIRATFEYKEDRIGKDFWIIHWAFGCEPFEDIEAEIERQRKEYA